MHKDISGIIKYEIRNIISRPLIFFSMACMVFSAVVFRRMNECNITLLMWWEIAIYSIIIGAGFIDDCSQESENLEYRQVIIERGCLVDALLIHIFVQSTYWSTYCLIGIIISAIISDFNFLTFWLLVIGVCFFSSVFAATLSQFSSYVFFRLRFSCYQLQQLLSISLNLLIYALYLSIVTFLLSLARSLTTGAIMGLCFSFIMSMTSLVLFKRLIKKAPRQKSISWV